MVFFQIIAGAFIGIVLYLLYTAVQKSYEDPLDDPLKVLEGEYGSYLAKKSYPFEDFIEKLLQSGTVCFYFFHPIQFLNIYFIAGEADYPFPSVQESGGRALFWNRH